MEHFDEAMTPEGWQEGMDIFAPEEEEKEEQTVQEAEGTLEKLKALWPDVAEVPEEVEAQAAGGENVVAAYAVWRSRRELEELKALREENALLRRNAETAAKAPVRGMKGGAKETLSDFERGFDSL